MRMLSRRNGRFEHYPTNGPDRPAGQASAWCAESKNQLLMALHRVFAKQDGKRIQIPRTHASRTAEAEELQGSLTQQTLGRGSDRDRELAHDLDRGI
jgi:hypothetical protein